MICKHNLKTKAKELTEGRRLKHWRQSTSLILLVIPALIASLGSVTDTLNCNCDCAYANEFPVAFEDPDMGKQRTITQEAI
jgi:hypothetical protein